VDKKQAGAMAGLDVVTENHRRGGPAVPAPTVGTNPT